MFRFRRRSRYPRSHFEAITRISSCIIGYAIRDNVSEIRVVPDELICTVMFLRQGEWATQTRMARDGFDLLNEFYRKAVNERNELEFFLEDKAMNFALLIKVQLTWTDEEIIELKINAPTYYSCDDEHYIEYSKQMNLSWTKE